MLQFWQRSRKIFQLHVGCILFCWDKTTTLSCEIVVYYSREKIICLWHRINYPGSHVLLMSLVITPVTGHRTNNVSCQLNQSILHYVSLMLHWSLIRGNLDIRPSGVGHDSIQVSVTNIAQICNVANFVATQFLSPHYCGVQLESYVGGWSTLVYPGLPWSTLVYPGLPSLVHATKVTANQILICFVFCCHIKQAARHIWGGRRYWYWRL